MTSDKKSGIFLCCGFLLLLLGAMPLNGCFLFLCWPAEFHRDPATGSVPYFYLWLSIGSLLWLGAITLIALGTKNAWRMLLMGLAGIGK